jgi:hypothetical protein
MVRCTRDINHSREKEFQASLGLRESSSLPGITPPRVSFDPTNRKEPHSGQAVGENILRLVTEMKNPWVRIGVEAWSLGLEASSVIGLRALKIAAGGASAAAETRLMFVEKIEAGWAIQGKALTGALGLTAHGATARTLAHYRRKVRSNQRRLAEE